MEIVLAQKIDKSIFESMIDGKGLRLVIFLCGCSHKCKNCQNKSTWDINNGIVYDIDVVVNYIINLYQKGNYDGITFSGGDPFYQKDKLLILIKKLRENLPNLNIWSYTGYVYENISNEEVLKYIDVLVDGPFIESKKDLGLRFRGSSNQRILYLKNGKIQKIK